MPAELDPLIHTPARLRIMSTLVALGTETAMVFPRLQQLVGMTAGNLSTHLTKLEQAGYVAVDKRFAGRSPVTYLVVTARGVAAYADYLAALRGIVAAAEAATSPEKRT